ncbi:hypothetical protein [Azospirillum brasilense]|uniref:Uncharacterized protein n=1 Tax=Azospirillum brasilense TaxID=192 RepID=A0A235HB48_AZOBR|nr:hypothetical protein [Azospirillum brasilense]OYD82946.1 hypothetical protein CHT98_17525 [Azospirillum brasilense]
MLSKLNHTMFDRRSGRLTSLEKLSASEEAFPTPGEVFGEMAITIAVFLAIGLLVNVLSNIPGL